MGIQINELTAKQIADIKERTPASQPRRFQVQEVTRLGSYTLDYHDTKEAAEKTVKQWEARDNLADDINEFIDEMAEKYKIIDKVEIRQIIKEH